MRCIYFQRLQFFQSVLSQKINTKILRKKWDGSSNEHNCFQWQKLWKCIKLQDQVPLGPDHLQLTLYSIGTLKVFWHYMKNWKWIGNFRFLFSAKTLLVSKLSKVKCRWSGPYSALSYILCRLSWQMIDIDVKTFIENSFIKTFTATMLSILISYSF